MLAHLQVSFLMERKLHINMKTASNQTALNAENYTNVDNKTLYAGIDPDSVRLDPTNARPALKTGAYEGK